MVLARGGSRRKSLEHVSDIIYFGYIYEHRVLPRPLLSARVLGARSVAVGPTQGRVRGMRRVRRRHAHAAQGLASTSSGLGKDIPTS